MDRYQRQSACLNSETTQHIQHCYGASIFNIVQNATVVCTAQIRDSNTTPAFLQLVTIQFTYYLQYKGLKVWQYTVWATHGVTAG